MDLFQTTPDRVEFHTGLDHIGVFSFSPNGLLRWYADCCGATLFNTLRNPKAAFSAIRVQRLADPAAIGPVRAHAFVGRPGGGYKHTGKAWFLLGLLRGPALARITGRWRDTPFFDIASGQPVRKVQIVDKGARADLLM